MLEPLKVRLEGQLGLFSLRIQNDRLIAGFTPNDFHIVCSWPERNTLLIVGCAEATKGSRRATHAWMDISKLAANIGSLAVACCNSIISFEAIGFTETSEINLTGTNNNLNFTNCAIGRLKLCSQRRNALNFERQPAITELDADLTNTWLQSLRLKGVTWSSLKGSAATAVDMYIESQPQERVFDFARDCDSTITVRTQSGRCQQVFSPHEQWTMALDVLRMNMEPTCTSALLRDNSYVPSAGSTAVCSVCRENLPDRLLLPCDHACLCGVCADRLRLEGPASCPICRQDVTEFHPITIAIS